MTSEKKVVIIGAGPAGISCAIQLKRHGINPVIFEKEEPGGLLHNASVVENYPGFPDGILAEDLITKLKQHLVNSGIETFYEEVVNVSYTEGAFTVSTVNSRTNAGTLVVASGTRPVIPAAVQEITSENPLVHYGVKELMDSSGKNIGIIGAGDAAFDYALNLSRKGNKVSVFNRGTNVKALPVLCHRLKKNRNIDYHENHNLINIVTQHENARLELSFNVENSTVNYCFDCLIFATGREPASGFIDPSVSGIKENLVSAGKLFFIGDVKGGRYRQATIAAGEGIRTAMVIFHESH